MKQHPKHRTFNKTKLIKKYKTQKKSSPLSKYNSRSTQNRADESEESKIDSDKREIEINSKSQSLHDDRTSEVKDESQIKRGKTIKRKANRKINRSIHPFKRRKIESLTSPKSYENKNSLKRKSVSSVNRELIPYKRTKLNRGDKRKPNFVLDESKKRFKDEKHRSYLPNQKDYEKWS